ncbi:MAG TPA: hypothetical protein VEX13_10785 [Chloroflexia bacterium]|nr:hypothetical protein [Chloroflexia bacterium]
MATQHTRANGANARSINWEDAAEEERPRRGNWLPLDDLDDDLYAGTPRLQTMPAPRRAAPSAHPEPERLRPTKPQPTRPGKKAASAPATQAVQARTVAMLAAGALTLLALYVVISSAVEWTQVKLDDLQYGRPRTMQVDAYVGHSEAEGVPSHFVAMNLNRRVTILEMPGSDSTKVNTIVGPYLFGQGEDLTPVQLNVQDVNGDAKPDLIVSVKSEQLIYLNDGATFKLITPEERAALQKALSAPAGAQSVVEEGGK